MDPINNEPTYEGLKLLREKLGENAAHIPTTNGGGMYGHLRLVTKPNVYFTLSRVPFAIPHDPVTYNIHIPLCATTGECAHMEKEHEKRKQEYNTCLVVSNTLKNQIVEAVKRAYLSKLCNTRFGYLTLPPLTC